MTLLTIEKHAILLFEEHQFRLVSLNGVVLTSGQILL